MGDIHALDGSTGPNGTISKRLAFHYLIPGPDQVAAASQDPELVGFVSEVPDITGTEDTAIKAGQVVEEIHTITYHPSEDVNTSVIPRAQDAYTARKQPAIDAYKARYHGYLTLHAET